MAWPKPEFQLDDSALESYDCGPASLSVAVDFMSRGRIHPSTENIRKKIPDHKGGTNPDGWAKALTAFAPGFEREGLTPPKFRQVDSLSHDMLRKQMDWGRGFVGAYDYGMVKKLSPRLCSSTSFTGLHAMFQMKFRTWDATNQGLVFDPLADGRLAGGYKRVVKGPKWWPWWTIRQALSGYSGKNEASGIIVWRSDIITPDTPDPTPPDIEDPTPPDEDQMDSLDKMYGYLSDLEEQYAALGEVIEDLREAVGPDNDSTSDAESGVRER
jgi:hypothetical protein